MSLKRSAAVARLDLEDPRPTKIFPAQPRKATSSKPLKSKRTSTANPSSYKASITFRFSTSQPTPNTRQAQSAKSIRSTSKQPERPIKRRRTMPLASSVIEDVIMIDSTPLVMSTCSLQYKWSSTSSTSLPWWSLRPIVPLARSESLLYNGVLYSNTTRTSKVVDEQATEAWIAANQKAPFPKYVPPIRYFDPLMPPMPVDLEMRERVKAHPAALPPLPPNVQRYRTERTWRKWQEWVDSGFNPKRNAKERASFTRMRSPLMASAIPCSSCGEVAKLCGCELTKHHFSLHPKLSTKSKSRKYRNKDLPEWSEEIIKVLIARDEERKTAAADQVDYQVWLGTHVSPFAYYPYDRRLYNSMRISVTLAQFAESAGWCGLNAGIRVAAAWYEEKRRTGQLATKDEPFVDPGTPLACVDEDGNVYMDWSA